MSQPQVNLESSEKCWIKFDLEIYTHIGARRKSKYRSDNCVRKNIRSEIHKNTGTLHPDEMTLDPFIRSDFISAHAFFARGFAWVNQWQFQATTLSACIFVRSIDCYCFYSYICRFTSKSFDIFYNSHCNRIYWCFHLACACTQREQKYKTKTS